MKLALLYLGYDYESISLNMILSKEGGSGIVYIVCLVLEHTDSLKNVKNVNV